MSRIVGYKCPICKTVNPKSVKYCLKCGHWLLDTIDAAQPVTKRIFTFKSFVLASGVFFVVLILIGIAITADTTAPPSPSIAVEDIQSKAISDFPYDELARNTEKYKGTPIHYTGKVVQVNERPSFLRIDVADTSDFLANREIIYVSRKDNAGRVLLNDIVDVWGVVKGPMTYKTVLGEQITIPEITSYHLDITTADTAAQPL